MPDPQTIDDILASFDEDDEPVDRVVPSTEFSSPFSSDSIVQRQPRTEDLELPIHRILQGEETEERDASLGETSPVESVRQPRSRRAASAPRSRVDTSIGPGILGDLFTGLTGMDVARDRTRQRLSDVADEVDPGAILTGTANGMTANWLDSLMGALDLAGASSMEAQGSPISFHSDPSPTSPHSGQEDPLHLYTTSRDDVLGTIHEMEDRSPTQFGAADIGGTLATAPLLGAEEAGASALGRIIATGRQGVELGGLAAAGANEIPEEMLGDTGMGMVGGGVTGLGAGLLGEGGRALLGTIPGRIASSQRRLLQAAQPGRPLARMSSGEIASEAGNIQSMGLVGALSSPEDIRRAASAAEGQLSGGELRRITDSIQSLEGQRPQDERTLEILDRILNPADSGTMLAGSSPEMAAEAESLGGLTSEQLEELATQIRPRVEARAGVPRADLIGALEGYARELEANPETQSAAREVRSRIRRYASTYGDRVPFAAAQEAMESLRGTATPTLGRPPTPRQTRLLEQARRLQDIVDAHAQTVHPTVEYPIARSRIGTARRVMEAQDLAREAAERGPRPTLASRLGISGAAGIGSALGAGGLYEAASRLPDLLPPALQSNSGMLSTALGLGGMGVAALGRHLMTPAGAATAEQRLVQAMMLGDRLGLPAAGRSARRALSERLGVVAADPERQAILPETGATQALGGSSRQEYPMFLEPDYSYPAQTNPDEEALNALFPEGLTPEDEAALNSLFPEE